MELSVIRRETTGSAPNQYNESETITKYEIMDGAPVRGETIPIRLFLGGFELTPTFRDVNKRFSTRYFLNLVLIDEENRRYFKQSEITIYRLPDDPSAAADPIAYYDGPQESQAVVDAQDPQSQPSAQPQPQPTMTSDVSAPPLSSDQS